MLKVSVLYPRTEGGKFDMEYFLRQHLPLVDKAWGAALIKKEIDAGLSGPGPGTPPTYVAAAHLYFDSIESFQAALGPQHKGRLLLHRAAVECRAPEQAIGAGG